MQFRCVPWVNLQTPRSTGDFSPAPMNISRHHRVSYRSSFFNCHSNQNPSSLKDKNIVNLIKHQLPHRTDNAEKQVRDVWASSQSCDFKLTRGVFCRFTAAVTNKRSRTFYFFMNSVMKRCLAIWNIKNAFFLIRTQMWHGSNDLTWLRWRIRTAQKRRYKMQIWRI